MNDKLYLDEEFRMLAKTYPADVSAIGVTVLIDYVEALDAELARLTAELALTEKKLCNIDRLARAEIAHRDEIIARLKEDAERLADGMIISPENEGDFCSYCGGMEHVDDCPITLHRALMKELEDKNRKLRLELNAPDYHQLLRAEIDRLVDGNAKFQEMATNKITGLRADIAIRDEYIKKCRG